MSRINELGALVPKALAVVILGGMGAVVVELLLGGTARSIPAMSMDLVDTPDRFAKLFHEAPAAHLPAIGAPASSGGLSASIAGLLGALGTRSEGARAKGEERRVGRKDARSSGSGTGAGAPPAQEAEARATLRAWFPETFLFSPIVVTDARGHASVEVDLPDQLTTWRVLGLAHDRAGHQAGGLAQLASTMPVYIDMAEPPTLRVGDRLALPVQVVNQTTEHLSASLSAGIEGPAAEGFGGGSVQVGPRESHLQHIAVRALRPGQASVQAVLGAEDRVERSFDVVPAGLPLQRTVSGSLASVRSAELQIPARALADASRLELMVYPGPLAVLDAELSRAAHHDGSLEEAAYAYALSGVGRELALRMGVEPDLESLRTARLRAYQDLVRHTRAPDVQQAVVVLAAAKGWPEDPLAAALAQRLAQQIAAAQSPDGSFAEGWQGRSVSIEQALVFTAQAARQTHELEPRVGQRAAGFVARNMDAVRDPVTAAALLSAGLVEERHQPRLRAMVRAGLEEEDDGGLVLRPTDRSRASDGGTPSVVACTALAALALAEDPALHARHPDLGAALLSRYRPGLGFGAGLDGLVVLEALAVLFPEPLPESVTVRLQIDGEQVLEQRLDLAAGYSPLVASTALPSGPGTHRVQLTATPAVPGLGYTLRETHWLPPQPSAPSRGFALDLEGPARANIGQPATLKLRAAPPAGERTVIDLALPAGLEPDEPSLEALVQAGTITDWDSSLGSLTLQVPAQPAGALLDASLVLVPTLAGTFHWGHATMALAREPRQRAEADPAPWVVSL